MDVLVVEDDPAQVRLLRALLLQSGLDFRISHAQSVSAAVTALAQPSYDVILLDLSLPDSVGLPTVKSIVGAAGEIPVIVLTGADESLGLASLRLGAHEYLRKGEVNANALVRCILYTVERKRTQQIARQQRHLREAAKTAERVLGIVGHELRTPLAALRATVEFLLTPGAKQMAEWDVFLKGIHVEVTRMAELVNNMLEAARFQSGKTQWNWSIVDLGAACQEALDVMRPLVALNRVELRCTIEAGPVVLRGDADAVRRLILNLVSNSCKFTQQGSIHINARHLLQADGAWVEITVKDTGTGISESVMSKLGQAFVLSSGALGSDYVKGTGLGLSICKAIVAAHGGDLAVTSVSGEGSVFTARLRADLEQPISTRHKRKKRHRAEAA